MSYDNVEDYADMMLAFADDAALAVDAIQNGNDRHPMAAWLQGYEFALRYPAYQARVIDE